VKRLLAATVIASAFFAAGCSSRDRSVSVDDLRKANAPYYYVGSSFESLELSHVQRYRDGEADILYGTCHVTGSEGGCSLPLALQHRLCHGIVTVSIFANKGRARRAATALRPLSKGARKQTPYVVFDRGVSC
jgi:hypothetical protein